MTKGSFCSNKQRKIVRSISRISRSFRSVSRGVGDLLCRANERSEAFSPDRFSDRHRETRNSMSLSHQRVILSRDFRMKRVNSGTEGNCVRNCVCTEDGAEHEAASVSVDVTDFSVAVDVTVFAVAFAFAVVDRGGGGGGGGVGGGGGGSGNGSVDVG